MNKSVIQLTKVMAVVSKYENVAVYAYRVITLLEIIRTYDLSAHQPKKFASADSGFLLPMSK
jgi:hypothetical protein